MINIKKKWHYTHSYPKNMNDINYMELVKDSIFNNSFYNQLINIIKSPSEKNIILRYSQFIKKNFTDILLIGSGGSTLGAQCFYSFKYEKTPNFHFLENIDPHTTKKTLSKLNKEKTYILIISKSGKTIEVLSQFLFLNKEWGILSRDQCLVITESSDNALRELSDYYKFDIIDHPEIGGRYSCLSIVGLLPASISGLKIDDIKNGAFKALNDFDQIFLDAFILYKLYFCGFIQLVLMSYCDRLNTFNRWYVQLISESLGKNNKGFTPISFIGLSDQHSQLQLYLDGPKDKVFTLITTNHEKLMISKERFKNFSNPISYLSYENFNSIIKIESLITLNLLKNRQLPTRNIHSNKINEEFLGNLLATFMLEVVMIGFFMKINPFDQPAIQEKKNLSDRYFNNF